MAAPQQTQTKEIVAPQRRMMDYIEKQRHAIEQVATKHLSPEKLLKYVGLAISRQPKIADCTPSSVLKCVITASQLGLDLSGTLGSAYIVPFKNKGALEATLIIGYRGLVDLIRRYCDIQVEARAVFQGDTFDWSFGTDPKIIHKPGDEFTGHAPSLTHVYAVFTWPDGRKTFEVMTRKEVDRVRSMSKAADSGPWADDGGDWNQGNGYIEMAKKTAVRRGVKLQPLTVEAQEAIETSDKADTSLDIVADVKATEVTAKQRLEDRVSQQRAADAEAEEQAQRDAAAVGMDGDGPTRVEQTAKAAEVAGKVNNAAPKADVKPATRRNARSPESLMGQQPAGPANNQTFGPTDGMDDLSALDDASDVNRE
jgi:recombination protein RecT